MKYINFVHKDDLETKRILNKLKDKLLANDYKIDSKEVPDIAIAIGGDGTFLQMLKKYNYNSEICYAGVNTGTLGFLQEISPENIDEFVDTLSCNNYHPVKVNIINTIVETDDSEKEEFLSLNEITIRDKKLNVLKLDIFCDDKLLEKYVGDGILICSSIGSTAYNLSLGGSIVDERIHSLQITPIAPINTVAYRSLINSVILPREVNVNIIPNNKNILLTCDGENYKIKNVKKILVSQHGEHIKLMRFKNNIFFEKINEKLI